MESNESSSRPPDVSGLVQAGISAARAGHHGWARDLLIRAIELDETCVSAWLWLSDVVENSEEKERCLARVLTLDPGGEVGRREHDGRNAAGASPEPYPSRQREPANSPVAEDLDSMPPAGPAPGRQPHTGGIDGDGSHRQQPADELCQAVGNATVVGSPVVPAQLDVNALLQAGIDAALAQDAGRARDLITRVVEVNERHISAWLWLSYVSDSPQERDRCVARVLSLAGQPVASPRPSVDPSALSPASAATPPAVTAPRPKATQILPQAAYASVTAGQGGYAPPGTPAFQSLAAEASLASGLVRGAVAEWASTWGLTALAYLAGITLAEVLTTFAHPQLGLVAHSLVLLVLLVHSARISGRKERAFVLSLAFAPLIRILSLSLPLVDFSLLYWYLITSVPLFAGTIVAARSLSYTWRDLGLTLRGWPLQIAIGLTGLVFGCVEYLILHPNPLISAPGWRSLALAALILTVSTGLLEELIFRGLLQRAAGDMLGRWGLTYVALLFAVLHVGYKSATDLLFVFAVGLFLGWIVQRTRSLLGVTLAHGMTNVVLFLIMPLLLQ